ncbi:efflux RND transporter permease subunit, partial [Wenyingzhuangia sp. 1_MG-2023]|nr:efflux RND transporter permease subunit [Wenyingzhuangia sp. 1_MG-2023]
VSERIASLMKSLPGTAEVMLNQADGMHYLTITPDATRIQQLALTVNEVQQSLRAALEGIRAGEVIYPDRQVPLLLRHSRPAQISAL